MGSSMKGYLLDTMWSLYSWTQSSYSYLNKTFTRASQHGQPAVQQAALTGCVSVSGKKRDGRKGRGDMLGVPEAGEWKRRVGGGYDQDSLFT